MVASRPVGKAAGGRKPIIELSKRKRRCLSAKPVRGPLGLGLDARRCVLLGHFDVLPNYLLCLRRRPQIPLFAPRSAG